MIFRRWFSPSCGFIPEIGLGLPALAAGTFTHRSTLLAFSLLFYFSPWLLVSSFFSCSLSSLLPHIKHTPKEASRSQIIGPTVVPRMSPRPSMLLLPSLVAKAQSLLGVSHLIKWMNECLNKWIASCRHILKNRSFSSRLRLLIWKLPHPVWQNGQPLKPAGLLRRAGSTDHVTLGISLSHHTLHFCHL